MKATRPLILASKSPRRAQILKMADLDFEIITQDIEEKYPDTLSIPEIPIFLSQKKAEPLLGLSQTHDILSADTIVVFNNQVIGKPKNEIEAFEILSKLCENTHTVITGVTILRNKTYHHFLASTEVTIRHLSPQQIQYYISKYQPFDKAGSYGIQDWIGVVGVSKVDGDFYNVMGLPLSVFYDFLVF